MKQLLFAEMCVNLHAKFDMTEKTTTMRRLFYVLFTMCTGVWLLTSCLGNSNDMTYYDDAVITAFTLGNLNRYQHTTSSTGKDSVYVTTVTGANCVMSIDHVAGRIFNGDSLPYGTDLKHVTCTLTTRNNGAALFKSLVSDSLFYYGVSDSIDFTKPRVVTVYSSNGEWERSYTVTLNAKQSNATGIIWTETTVADYLSHTPDSSWAVRAAEAGLTPIGTAAGRQYAQTADGSQLMMTTDDGATWTGETIDSDVTLLPQHDIAMAGWPYAQAMNADYSLMVGRSTDTASGRQSVWRKISTSGQGQWVLVPENSARSYYLPSTVSVALAYCGTTVGVLAFASDGTLYRSIDQGITWKTDADYSLPAGATGKLETVTDNDGTIWLLSTKQGKAWRGKLTIDL